MNRLDELHGLLSENVAKVGDLLKKEDEAEKKKSKAVWIFAALGIIAVTAAAIYGLYRFFDDDFFEDEEEKTEESADDVKEEETADENTVTDEMTEE